MLRHSYDSFIKSCSLTYKHEGLLGAGISCPENKTLFTILDPNYVKCFTVSVSRLKKAVQKLKLLFYLDDFVKYVYPTYHSKSIQQIGKGVLVAVHLNPEVNIKLPSPYGTCNESTKVYYADNSYTITPESCVWDCMQEYMITKCGCLDIDLPVTRWQLEKYLYCGQIFQTPAHQENENQTVRRIKCYSNLKNANVTCQCDEPCKKYDYKPTINQIPWPHESFHLAFYEKVIEYDGAVSKKFEYYGKLYEAFYDEHDNISHTANKIYQSSLIERNYVELIIQFKSSEVTVLERGKV